MANHSTHLEAQPAIAKKLCQSYIIGFLLAVILVVAAYAIVQHHLLAGKSLYLALTVLIVLQLIVQVVFFLRLNTATENDKWNYICFLFTILIMAIVVTGSLWIMYNLNYYMVN